MFSLTLPEQNRTFGLEFEIIGISGDAAARAINNANIGNGLMGTCRHETYNHTTRPYWKAVPDGSLRGASQTCEIVSPIMRGDLGMEIAVKVLDALKSAGATVNESCGFHIHFGVNDFTTKNFHNLCALYLKLEGTLDSFNKKFREEAYYCQSLRSLFTDRVVTESNRNRVTADIVTRLQRLESCANVSEMARIIIQDNRQSKLNLCAYARHGTVEIRHAAGTVDSKEMAHWLTVCACLIDDAKRRRFIHIATGIDSEKNLYDIINAESRSAVKKYYAVKKHEYRPNVYALPTRNRAGARNAESTVPAWQVYRNDAGYTESQLQGYRNDAIQFRNRRIGQYRLPIHAPLGESESTAEIRRGIAGTLRTMFPMLEITDDALVCRINNTTESTSESELLR